MGLRLGLETLAARGVGAVSRAAGRGGGTTFPGKLLWKIDPGAVDALAARLPAGVALVSGTNGKTTTTAMAARILGRDHRLAWNRESSGVKAKSAATRQIRVEGLHNVLYLFAVALTVLASGIRHRDATFLLGLGIELPLNGLVRDVILVALALLSWRTTKRAIRRVMFWLTNSGAKSSLALKL